MMPMKTNGMIEVRNLIKRVRGLQGLARIGDDDADYIVARLNQIAARVEAMYEVDDLGRDVGNYAEHF